MFDLDSELDATVASDDAAIGRAVKEDRKARFAGHYDDGQRFYWRDDDIPDSKVQRRWKKFDKANAEDPKKQITGWETDALAAYDAGKWNTVAGLATWLREKYKKKIPTDPNFGFTQNIVGFGARRLIFRRRPAGDNDPHHNQLLHDLEIGHMGSRRKGRKCKCCKKRPASLCDNCAEKYSWPPEIRQQANVTSQARWI